MVHKWKQISLVSSFFVSWQLECWVFDDGWFFICKFKAICIKLVSSQAVCVSITYGFIMFQYQMPSCTLIQYMHEEMIDEHVPTTLWQGNRLEVPSHLGVKDWPFWFLRLLWTVWAYDVFFWEALRLKNQSLNEIKSTSLPPKTKQDSIKYSHIFQEQQFSLLNMEILSLLNYIFGPNSKYSGVTYLQWKVRD